MFFETTNTIADLEMYLPSFRCIKDHKNSDIWGNYSTGNARSLIIVFEKCDRSVEGNECAEESTIKNWMQGRYLLIVEN